MNTIKSLATRLLAAFSVMALVGTPAAANGLSAEDMAFAFGGNTPASARSMTTAEMQATEGAGLPVIVVAAIGAAGRKVTQEAAVRIARNNTSGVFIHANTRQQANQIAKAASGGNNSGIRRELHTPTPNNPVQYNHFHPTNSNAHVTWGKPK